MALTPQQRRRRAYNNILMLQMMAAYKSSTSSAASSLLATWADSNGGLAFDFTDISGSQPFGSGKIIDGASPSNNWETSSTVNPFDKLTWTGASLRMCYGSDGVLRYAPHNLILRSQEFANASWTWGGGTPTFSSDAIAAPDGTTTADKIIPPNSVMSYCRSEQYVAVEGANYFAVRAKAAENTYIALGFYSGTTGDRVRNFNLSTGALAGTCGVTAPTSSAITALGNGWYLCEIWETLSGGTYQNSIYLKNNDAANRAITGDGTSGVYLWGAQFQRTPVHSTDYIATTSSAVYRPRIDYDPSTLAVRGLLVEEARTNSILRSQEFSNASWSISNATITADQITAPDGTTTADLLTSTNLNNFIQQQITAASGVTFTASVFAKAGTQTWLRLSIYDSAHREGFFNLSTGVVGTPDAGVTQSIQSVGNGWYRCSVTYTTGAVNPFLSIYGTSSDTGAAEASGTIYIWGAQLEAGAFATSYIPTTSASATRAADRVTIASTLFNLSSTAGTVYVKSRKDTVGSGQDQIWALQTDVNNIHFGWTNNGTRYGWRTINGGVIQANGAGTIGDLVVGNVGKLAYAFAADDFAHVTNGGTPATDALGTLPTVGTLEIGSNGISSSTGPHNGHIQQIMHLPQRLSNANLQTLTT